MNMFTDHLGHSGAGTVQDVDIQLLQVPHMGGGGFLGLGFEGFRGGKRV